jgi:phenylalanyl-tRNA synthetase alpha chain
MDVVKTLSPLELKILPFLDKCKSLKEIKEKSGLQEIEVMRALQWLSNKKIVEINLVVEEKILLDSNGKDYAKNGLPEKRFLEALTKPSNLDEIAKKTKLSKQEVSVCIGQLKKKASINIKPGMVVEISEPGKKSLLKKSLEELFLEKLKKGPVSIKDLQPEERLALKNLSSRKNIVKKETIKTRNIKLLQPEITKAKIPTNLSDSLTPELIRSGKWKDKEFRHYDVGINVPKIASGRRHPYNESMNLIRQAFLEMGFQEMIGPWVETSFWGMDSMWIAQDHPMREAQDTFYLDKKGDLPDKTFLKKVKAAHENGYTTGSTGHTKYWDPEEASKLILRQHSTATTFRYFYEKKLNRNCKYFYIADNFRNEAIDATHLPEFGQAEGFIMGDKLTLADLMGFIKEFYAKLGITKIRFKPTFNPYTEPSMEAHYYNEKLGKWYALINSGIFRPEALAPYGITKSVIAWGMGSSRIAAVLTGKAKLKDILGPEVGFDWIKNHKRLKTL